jgi:hypothetical protein
MFFPNSRYLRMMLRWQLVNKITGMFDDGTFSAEINGHRMSGDPNTACGNTLIMSALCYEYARTKGIRVEFINDGDDSVFFMEDWAVEAFLHGAGEWFLSYGFRMEFEEPVSVLEHVEFCQAKPVWNGTSYVMCRNPHVCRAKDTSTFKAHNAVEYTRWMRSVGEGGLSLASGIPVLQEFYLSLIRSTPGSDKTELERWSGLGQLSAGMTMKISQVSDRARLSFYLAWGVPASAQIIQEQYYSQVTYDRPPTFVPKPISHPSDHAYSLFAGRM